MAVRAIAALIIWAIPNLGLAQAVGASKPDSAVILATVDSAMMRLRALMADLDTATTRSFHSRADSADWERARSEAARASEYRVVVSLFDRRVFVIVGPDTLLRAPAAVASGMRLDYAGRSWTFRTPRGRHRVIRKVSEPVWNPPDWLYAEVAYEEKLGLERLTTGKDVRLHDGSTLTMRGNMAGVIRPGSTEFLALPTDEHIVFDSTLFIPPFGSLNRRVKEALGRYALDLGDGYMIHGTPDESAIGRAITHGCIRLGDDDIRWLFEFVPEGTPVFIY